MGMKRITGRRIIGFDEFFSNKPEPPRRSGQKRAPHKKTGKKARLRKHILRLFLMFCCIALLLGITFSGNIESLFTGAAQNGAAVSFFGFSRGKQAAVKQVLLTDKPAFPGCTGIASRRESVEKIAKNACPSVVGVVQYQNGSLQESGEGSGIIMSADGYIITNNHVVEDASKLEVVLKSGKKMEAELVGSDARMDLAVIKVQAQQLPSASFGNSDQCEVGEQVVAIGNPSGLKLAGSVTQGIISALNRNVDVGNGPMNLIQTDAAINPGNSGGALVNMYGQVVGINSAKIAQQGYEGIGFSIPINAAKPIVDSILQYGYVKGRVKFGFSCRAIDQMTAKLNNIPVGIYIDAVETDGPAAKCGLKPDDIILKVDGASVNTAEELIVARDKHKPGEKVTLTVFRRKGEQRLSLPLTLAEDRGDRAAVAQKGSGW